MLSNTRARKRFDRPAWLLVVACLTIASAVALAWRARVRDEGVRAFQVQAGNIGSAVTSDMRRIDDVTVALRSSVAIDPHLTSRTLARWYAGMNAGGRYPGLVGLTFVEYVPAAQIHRFTAALRADPVPGLAPPAGPLRIHPTGTRKGYCLIRAAAPQQPDLASEVAGPGLDVCASAGARLFEATRDSGQLTTVMLKESPGPRVLVVIDPIYRGVATPTSTAGRRDQLVGWALGQFDVGAVLGGALGGTHGVRIELFRRNLIYTRSVATVVGPVTAVADLGRLGAGPALHRSFTISADGRWIVTVAKVWSWGFFTPDTQAIAILAIGLLIGALGLWLRRAQRQAEHANRAKSVFLSRISHELRTPLNSILGFGQLLAGDHMSPRQHEWVHDIVRSGRHLLELINELLDVARIEAGQLTVSADPIVVGQVLEEAIAIVTPQADERGVELRVEDAGCQYVVCADRRRLTQVLLNLLGNAIKYNREDGAVTVTCMPAGSSRLAILIRDTGVGIPPGGLGELFTPFERLAAEHSGIEGTGLGLALSRRLMQLMDGALHVESETGVGSTFTIELPLVDSSLIAPDRELRVAALR